VLILVTGLLQLTYEVTCVEPTVSQPPCFTNLMSGRVVLLCGRSFSGKSTVASYLADALGGQVVSHDAINAERGLFGGDGITVTEWARTLDIAHERVMAATRKGGTVVVDDTSSPAVLRDGWRELSSAVSAPLALVYVDASRDTIFRRQAQNRATQQRRDVSDEVMAEHLDGFEPPAAKERAIYVGSGLTPLADVAAAVLAVFGRDPVKDSL